jgi:hypothetical protein
MIFFDFHVDFSQSFHLIKSSFVLFKNLSFNIFSITNIFSSFLINDDDVVKTVLSNEFFLICFRWIIEIIEWFFMKSDNSSS